MKRFFFEEEDDDDEDMMNDAERMMPEFIPEFFAMPQQENPAHYLLNCSMRICEQSFFWRLYGPESKIKLLKKVFGELSELLGGYGLSEEEKLEE